MARIFPPRSDIGALDLDGFLATVEALHFDPGSAEFIEGCAQALARLASHRTLIDDFVAKLRTPADWARDFAAPQSFFLGKSRRFTLRANVWLPPRADTSTVGELERKLYAYELAHNHDIGFLTVGFFGPGYETDLYEIDESKLAGTAGEPVDLGQPRRAQLTQGTVIHFRAHEDIHIQHQPTSLSMSINLIFGEPEVHRDQLLFDVEKSIVVGPPAGGVTDRWEGALRMAAIAGDARTPGLLRAVADGHSNARLARVASELAGTSTPG